jgi:hypothetical protein
VKRAADTAATVFCQNTALATFSGGVMKLRTTLDYQVTQGELKSLRVKLATGQRVLRVEGASMRTWELKPEGDAEILNVELLKGGYVRVRTSSTEMGQGTRTVFAQIVAETLGLPCDRVETFDPDTALVPDSGPTVASRTVAIVGRIVADAAQALDRALAAKAGRECGSPWSVRDFIRAGDAHLAAGGEPFFRARFANPSNQRFDDVSYVGEAYAAYAWAATVVEVEVDLASFESRSGGSRARRRSPRDPPTLRRGQLKAVSPRPGRGLFEGRDTRRPHGRQPVHQLRQRHRRAADGRRRSSGVEPSRTLGSTSIGFPRPGADRRPGARGREGPRLKRLEDGGGARSWSRR